MNTVSWFFWGCAFGIASCILLARFDVLTVSTFDILFSIDEDSLIRSCLISNLQITLMWKLQNDLVLDCISIVLPGYTLRLLQQ